jgi:hypothetical protein
MRCYDSAGNATQCQDGTHSCVTFVELTQSVLGNASGTDKVKVVNATSMCGDKTLAEDTGIVCDGPGVKVTSTGSMVYECCRGDLCNKDFMEALVNLQVPWDLCVNTCARLCIKMYACKYVCTCIISLCVYA